MYNLGNTTNKKPGHAGLCFVYYDNETKFS